MKRIITIYSNFKNCGGAQAIALSLTESLSENMSDLPVVLTVTPLKDIHSSYIDRNVIFEKFSLKNIFKYKKNSVFISHSRRQTSFLVLLSYLFKIQIVHVAHNTFNNLKCLTWFPKHIIAVSNGVKKNLINYFGIKENRITVIFNGITDKKSTFITKEVTNKIEILLAGRITSVKQQIKLVEQTRDKLNSHIKFYFAGEGDDLEILKQSIGKSTQYFVLGQIDLSKELVNYDYVCLFSEKEGLPIVLIEACMFFRPLITNDLLSVKDVNINGYNGFVYTDWAELIQGINSLPLPGSEEYNRLALNSRKQYEDNFTLNKMLSSYRNYLDSSFRN